MSVVISKLVAPLLILFLTGTLVNAQHSKCRRTAPSAVNKREEKSSATVEKSAAEVKAEAEAEACAASSERPKPEGAVKVGVLSGKAISLPKPPYPAEAKEAKASGLVAVNIVTDETGRVVWARAISGHPLLWVASVKAACSARFTPTTISGRAVKTETSITYNFLAQ